jgi:hypothetical protein
MALVLADRVQQTGTANTTVSFTLSGSVTGFQSFAVVGNTNTTYYSALDGPGNWEVGIGTYSTTGPTLARTTIISSSNAGSAVTFSGTVNVILTYPSSYSVRAAASGSNSEFATGTRLSFAQASAPTGWAQDTTDNANNRMLRVVSSTGNGIGGSASPILNNTVPSHTHGFSTGGQSNNHVHGWGNYTGGVTENHYHIQNVTANEGSGPYPRADYNSDGSYSGYDQGVGTSYISNNHAHYVSGDTGGYSADHSHSGTTDNGSSQTNWSPRYIDMIICAKS